LSAGDLRCIKWCVDASFAVHPDCKSYAGAATSFEDSKGAAKPVSRKQRLNTKSSAESELIGVNDASSVMILWTKLFMEEQGDEIDRSPLCQDNNGAALLEESGKKSSGKKT
jgi:hypothetical protein